MIPDEDFAHQTVTFVKWSGFANGAIEDFEHSNI